MGDIAPEVGQCNCESDEVCMNLALEGGKADGLPTEFTAPDETEDLVFDVSEQAAAVLQTLEAAEALRLDGNNLLENDSLAGALVEYEKASQLLDTCNVEGDVNLRKRKVACLLPTLLKQALCCLRQTPCEAFQALQFCERAIREEPDSREAILLRAKALVALGEVAEAFRQLSRVRQLKPSKKDQFLKKELDVDYEHLMEKMQMLQEQGDQDLVCAFDVFLPPSVSSHRESVDKICGGTDATMLGARRLGFLLGQDAAVDQLVRSASVSLSVIDSLAALAHQAIWMGIDYKTLGLGWDHPRTRAEYRIALHPSTCCEVSRRRAAESRCRLVDLVSKLQADCDDIDAEAAVVQVFLVEIGADDLNTAAAVAADSATYEGVRCALDAELLLPLRAFNEGERFMLQTYGGDPVPQEPVRAALENIFKAVLSKPRGFTAWRYENSVGVEQLRGLSTEQLATWREATAIDHTDLEDIRTHEDGATELGFFWATKIGGPSHGFDYEAQCLLPLLANARHKVVLVSIPAWPAHPVGRAHFRLLWTASPDGSAMHDAKPRLWLEAVNLDFSAEETGLADKRAFIIAVLRHAIKKADDMTIPLTVSDRYVRFLEAVVVKDACDGIVDTVDECLVLRPSNGVLEASDYLSQKHDWVQLVDEVTEPIRRALYIPADFPCEVTL